jgi:hypothetical protein
LPIYIPPSAVIGGIPVTITVHNSLICEEPNYGRLSVTKKVDPDPRAIAGNMIFPMTVTCTNPPSPPTIHPLNVHNNTSTVPFNVPVGSHCTVAEFPMPALPPGCTWLPPTFSPATVPIAGGLNQEMVTNGYTCHGGPACPPPQIMNVDNICVCPNGQPPVGGACGLPPPVCPPPQVPNARNTGCVCPGNEVLRRGKCVEPEIPKRKIKCPRGTELKDGECVKLKREPRVEPDDMIRGIQSIPGTGGGSPRGGGATPGRK